MDYFFLFVKKRKNRLDSFVHRNVPPSRWRERKERERERERRERREREREREEFLFPSLVESSKDREEEIDKKENSETFYTLNHT